MVVSKEFILEKPFIGAPREDNFKLVEKQLEELQNGGRNSDFFFFFSF